MAWYPCPVNYSIYFLNTEVNFGKFDWGFETELNKTEDNRREMK